MNARDTAAVRVLLVEDDPDDADLLSRALRRSRDRRFEIRHVESVGRALEEIAAATPDVILSDLHVTDAQGLETLERLYLAAPQLPIIVLTGALDRTLALQALKLGAQDYFDKEDLQPAMIVRSIEYAIERKRADLSRWRLAAIVESAEDAIISESLDGTIAAWNLGAERMFGHAAADVIGRPGTLLQPDDRRDEDAELRTRIAAGERVPPFETVYSGKDGTPVPVAVTVSAVHDAIGRLVGVARIVRDIGERRRLQAQLRDAYTRLSREHDDAGTGTEPDADAAARAQRRLAGIVDSAMDAIVTMDEAQRVVVFNRSAEVMFGCPRGEAIGQPIDRFIPARLREAHRAHLEAYARNGKTARPMGTMGRVTGLRANGEEFPLEASISRERTPQGFEYTVVMRDVSERVRTERYVRETEERSRRLLEVSPDAIVIHRHNAITWLNPAALRLFGASHADDLVGRSLLPLVADDHRGGVAATIGRVVERREFGGLLDVRMNRLDGAGVDVEVSSAPLSTGEGVDVLMIVRDVSERKAAQQRIARLNRVYAVLSAINAAIVRIRDRQELFEEACRVLVDEGGFPMAFIGIIDRGAGDRIEPVAHAGRDDGLLGMLRLGIEPGMPGSQSAGATAVRENRAVIVDDIEASSELVALREQCLARGFRSAVALPVRSEGRSIGIVAIYAQQPHSFNAEELKLLEELSADISLGIDFIRTSQEAEFLAHYDTLTGLPNRALFLDRLGRRVADHDPAAGMLGVVLVDLERFRSINETYGRAAGDDVLRMVAERLRIASPGVEPPARIGADAFGVVLHGLPDAPAFAQAVERVLGHTFGTTYRVEGTDLRLSSKAGIALFPDDGRDADTLFRNAEAAREQAKHLIEPYLYYAPAMNAELSRRLATENRLRHGLENDEFVVHYQPKVDARSGAVVAAEALLRWNDPENGLVSPQQFVSLLEETGLIVDTGRWVIRRVMEDVARWRARGLHAPRIAVNVSALQLRRSGFLGELREIVAAAGGGRNAGLDLEITESALMVDLSDSVEKLVGIRDLGIEIAIDDFGTGYSSLSYLARLPANTIKIDRSFVLDMTAGAAGLAIVSSLISLAHALNFKVVAEGVETEEQAKLLRLLRCDQMQGFLFHGVLAAERFEALLERA